MESNVKKFAKEARARLLINKYSERKQKQPSGRVFKIQTEKVDEEIYNKVCDIIGRDCVTNPLGLLIDRQFFEKLNECDRLKYVFKLSKKYVEMLERYRKEHAETKPRLALTI